MSRIATTFANPGDWILAEEWTYPSALYALQPWGIKAAPVAVDGEGLCAIDLRRVLAEWNEDERGGKRFVYDPISCYRHNRQISVPTSFIPFLSARILPALWVSPGTCIAVTLMNIATDDKRTTKARSL